MKFRTGKHARKGRPIETGVIHKPWQDRITVALVFPNTYPVGITNLGFQSVYRLLNEMDAVVCERAFLPEKRFPNPACPLKTEESGRLLAEFDIIAFSVSFENDYLHILTILDLAGIPLRSKHRKDFHPLVIAGGVACWLNPEPWPPFSTLSSSEKLKRFYPHLSGPMPRAPNDRYFLKRLPLKYPVSMCPAFTRQFTARTVHWPRYVIRPMYRPKSGV